MKEAAGAVVSLCLGSSLSHACAVGNSGGGASLTFGPKARYISEKEKRQKKATTEEG